MTYTNIASNPDWLSEEMPPGYRNRLEEIERLSRDLEEMGRFGRLLCGCGPELRAVVGETFAALGFETVADGRETTQPVVVALDGRRRLLLHVSGSDRQIQRRDPEIAELFRLLHENASDEDRVVLVANADPETRPADRGAGIEPAALQFLTRLGANFLPAATLFAMWSLSLQNPRQARRSVDSLHAQDGGLFHLAALASV